jgi:Tol biopolymer transport system component
VQGRLSDGVLWSGAAVEGRAGFFSTAGIPAALEFADANGDGFDDYVWIGKNGRVHVTFNDGADNFMTEVVTPPLLPGYVLDAKVADVDQDGIQDVVLLHDDPLVPTSRVVSIALGDATGRFALGPSRMVSNFAVELVGPIGNVAGDARPEILVKLDEAGKPRLQSLVMNLGQLTLQDVHLPVEIPLLPLVRVNATTLDVDDDGRLDLLGEADGWSFESSAFVEQQPGVLRANGGSFFASDSPRAPGALAFSGATLGSRDFAVAAGLAPGLTFRAFASDGAGHTDRARMTMPVFNTLPALNSTVAPVPGTDSANPALKSVTFDTLAFAGVTTQTPGLAPPGDLPPGMRLPAGGRASQAVLVRTTATHFGPITFTFDVTFVNPVDPRIFTLDAADPDAGWTECLTSVDPIALEATCTMPTPPDKAWYTVILERAGVGAPVVDAGPDQTGGEGQELQGFADFVDAPMVGHTATIKWESSAPAVAAEVGPGTVSGSYVYADDGPRTVEICVTDSGGLTGCDSFLVTVANVAPTVNAGADQSAGVGATVSLLPATFNDLGTLDTHTATVDWGDGSGVQVGTVTEAPFGPPGSTSGANGTVAASHAYATIGTYTSTVCVTDDESATSCDSFVVTVDNNVAPVVNAGPDQSGGEGQELHGFADFVDAPMVGHTATVKWESSAPAVAAVVGPGTVSSSYVYADDGPHTVEVCVTDGGGLTGCDSFLVTVANVAPTVNAGADQSAGVGATVSLIPATFNDLGTLDTHTATVDWGDGSGVQMGTVTEASFGPPGSTSGANGTVAASHAYTAIGTYTPTVCVTDDESATSCDSFVVTVGPPAGAGLEMVFASLRHGNFEIYGRRGDGTEVRLTHHGASDLEPALSPDRAKIVFTSTRSGHGDLYLMNADGTGVTRLTDHPAIDGSPEWSPDGTKVIFASNRTGGGDIYVMFADGSAVTRLTTHPAIDASPDWSRDGTKIAFSSTRSGNGDIYVMNADGTSVHRITRDPAPDLFPSWSPDGSRLAFSSSRVGLSDVYVMLANGTRVSRLTTQAAIDVEPAWGTSGSILFSTRRHGNFEIYRVNGDGRQTRLTNSPAADISPHW